MKHPLYNEPRIERTVIFILLFAISTMTYATEVKRRSFLIGGVAYFLAPQVFNKESCREILGSPSLPSELTPILSSAERAELLFNHSMMSRDIFQYMTLKEAKSFFGAKSSPNLTAGKYRINAADDLRQLVNYYHEDLFNRGVGHYVDPDIIGGDLPKPMVPMLRSLANSIVIVQDSLAKEFRIPISRIEREMHEILNPQENLAVRFAQYPGDVDPNPDSLGLEFHQRFYEEFGRLEPKFAPLLRASYLVAYSNPGGYIMDQHRFYVKGEIKEYIEKTGVRLMLLNLADAKPLHDQWNKAVEKTHSHSGPQNWISYVPGSVVHAVREAQMKEEQSARERASLDKQLSRHVDDGDATATGDTSHSPSRFLRAQILGLVRGITQNGQSLAKSLSDANHQPRAQNFDTQQLEDASVQYVNIIPARTSDEVEKIRQ